MTPKPEACLLDASRSALLTDLYQLTMMQAYQASHMSEIASFEFFFRRLPPGRSFLLSAGLEPLLDWLEGLAFTAEEIDWLRSLNRFDPEFLETLTGLRFRGEVSAVPEGTVLFANEPMVRVTAPIMQAQLVETRLINLLHYQTLVATKAARCVLAAQRVPVVDFGLRRAPGAEAGMLAARAAWIAGFDASSNMLAGMRFGIPLAGTMAHAYVQAHEAEALAFESFAHANPAHAVLLIDTYDTEQGAHRAVAVAQTLARHGIELQGVRIDSGDLAPMTRRVRKILNDAGLSQVRILVSGNLDEWQIAALNAVRAPIDVYCVGTALTTSLDAPALDCACKLVEYAGRPRDKRSIGKQTLPGCKQVWRRLDAHACIAEDLISLSDEAFEPSRIATDPRQLSLSGFSCASTTPRPLLQVVMREGIRTRPAPTLAQLRDYAASELASLPAASRELDGNTPPPVRLSKGLQALVKPLDPVTNRGRGTGLQMTDTADIG
jgi:nicotinate phosphoribosyltransferase